MTLLAHIFGGFFAFIGFATIIILIIQRKAFVEKIQDDFKKRLRGKQ